MKNLRIVALLISFTMVIGMFAACGSANQETAKTEPSTQQVQKEEPKKEEAKKEEPKKVEKLYVGVAIRSLSNPYMVQVKEGAEMFVNSLPEGSAELQILTCEGSDEKQINDIKALIAKGGKNTILYVDPNQAPDAAEIAQICEEAGVYWTSVWSTADGIYPMDYKYYVDYQSPDDVKAGYDIATAMFKTFKTPGKGNILAVQGMLANTASINRFKGLQKAMQENPDIKMLDTQAGDWDPKKAFTLTETWLSKYKDIDGIWAADDNMALAVVQALKNKSLNGKVKVVGVAGVDDAVKAVKSGDMAATWGVNGWLQGFFGLAWPYSAYTGKIDTKTLKPEQRMFHTEGIPITKDNVAEYENNYIKNKPKFNIDDIFKIIVRPMDMPKK